MNRIVDMPLWVVVLILFFAVIAALDKMLLPSVRWFLRKRMERVVAQLNTRLQRPIQPFKLAQRHDMIQRLIYDPEVNKAIVEYARENGVREDVAFEQARRYAREIVPSFSASAYFGFAIRAAKWLSKTLYHVRLEEFDHQAFEDVDPDASVVFVMNHRSNMDYVLVTWLAAERTALSYAVGEWARVWPLSRLIKAMGAFFIRRKSRNALYRKVLARYVRLSTDGGVTQAVFPEGGLSRTGALCDPKMGFMKYLIEGRDDEARDIVFVPVAINYDRVMEDRVLIASAKREDGRFPARISVLIRFLFRQLWLKLRGRLHHQGIAAVAFGVPLSLTEFQKSADPSVKALAHELMDRIAAEVPLLPVPVLCNLLLDDSNIPLDGLSQRINDLLAQFSDTHPDYTPTEIHRATEIGVALLKRRRVVHEEGGQLIMNPDERELVEFYAASIRHLFRDRSK